MSAQPIRIGVAGAAGRMGLAVIDAIYKAVNPFDFAKYVYAVQSGSMTPPSHFLIPRLVAAVESRDNAFLLGKDAHVYAGRSMLEPEKVLFSEKFNPKEVDVFIDFSTPQAAVALSETCRKHGIAMVIGATGFSDAEMKKLRDAAADIAMVVSPNMSVGVHAMFSLAATVAQLLRAGALGGGYDIEIFEAHHRHKKDAPSGTALRLGEIVAQATGVNFSDVAKYDRQGRDNERPPSEIGVSAIRGGDIVGEHRLIFSGNGEQLEIVHRSSSRANYAFGAVLAAIFAAHAKPGWYDMQAVLAS